MKTMHGKLTLTAVVAGFPLELKQPKPLPGETLFHLVIRNHSGEWRNCVERLSRSTRITSNEAYALLRGDFTGVQNGEVRSEVEKFMNWRLPAYGRTIQSLSELKGEMKKPLHSLIGSFELIQILWPRQNDPDGNKTVTDLSESMGAKIIWISPGPKQGMDLLALIEHVEGEFMWLVPGGTKFNCVIVSTQLQRVFLSMQATPQCAMYIDYSNSILYNVTALKDLSARGITISPDSREMARNLGSAGYKVLMDKDARTALCQLEPEYGGPKLWALPEARSASPWWKRVFGK